MERELIYLLADLCVKWGFCIPPEDIEQISKMNYYHADDFAPDVVVAEGMDENSRWKTKIAERFAETRNLQGRPKEGKWNHWALSHKFE